MSCIIRDTVAFIVKTGGCFRRTEGRRGEDKAQGGQRDPESHGFFPLSRTASYWALVSALKNYAGLSPSSICKPEPDQTGRILIHKYHLRGSFQKRKKC